MKSRIYIFLLLTLAATTTLQAQKDLFNPIHTGVTSISIAPDARAAALGDVGCATDPYYDTNNQYWNPAKYPFSKNKAGVSLNYTPWLRQLVKDIDLANVNGFWRLDSYSALSASLTYFSLGEVIASLGTIRPYEMGLDFAYSRLLGNNLSAAVALRYIRSDLQYNYNDEVTPGNAFAADIALFYNNYVGIGRRDCMFGFGLNISNIGTKISYDGGRTQQFIPTNMRLGLSLLVPIDEYNSISFSFDANKLLVPTRPTYAQFMEQMHPDEKESTYQYTSEYASWLESTGYNDIGSISGMFKSFSDAPNGFKEELQEIYWGLGIEYCYNEQFFIRGGYHYEHQNKGNRKYFALGAGFRMNVFQIDAAYLISTTQSNPLDKTLRFSLAFNLDSFKSKNKR